MSLNERCPLAAGSLRHLARAPSSLAEGRTGRWVSSRVALVCDTLAPAQKCVPVLIWRELTIDPTTDIAAPVVLDGLEEARTAGLPSVECYRPRVDGRLAGRSAKLAEVTHPLKTLGHTSGFTVTAAESHPRGLG